MADAQLKQVASLVDQATEGTLRRPAPVPGMVSAVVVGLRPDCGNRVRRMIAPDSVGMLPGRVRDGPTAAERDGGIVDVGSPVVEAREEEGPSFADGSQQGVENGICATSDVADTREGAVNNQIHSPSHPQPVEILHQLAPGDGPGRILKMDVAQIAVGFEKGDDITNADRLAALD